MADATLWVKLRNIPGLSWHIVGKGGFTRCGRTFLVGVPTALDLPMGEKSCKTCLRLTEHDHEKAGT